MNAAPGKSKRVDDEVSSLELENTIRGGTRVVLAGQLASQLVSFAVLAVLYRWVTPEQFGLLGMAVPLLLLSRIFATMGLNVATVQRRHLSPSQLSSLFWLGLLLAGLMALCTSAGGILLSAFYETPALQLLCTALAGTLVIAALGSQHQAILERKLKIGRVTLARLLGQISGGLAAIALALTGAGVWALVAQQYVELSVIGLAVWGMDPWRPRRPGRGEPIGDLLRFGGYYSLSSVMFYVAQNADKILIAALLGATQQGKAALGMYSQAFNLMMRPVHLISSPMTGIMLPSLSRVAQQPQEYARLVAKFYRMVGVVLIPAGIGVFLVAADAMQVLGGTAWIPAGQFLQALAPTILVQGFLAIAGSVFASAGRADRLFYGSLACAMLLLTGYAVGFGLGTRYGPSPWGPTLGVAWSLSVLSVGVLFWPYMFYCFRSVGLSLTQVFRPLRLPLLAAACMGVLVWVVQQLMLLADAPLGVRLAVAVTVGVIVYALIARREIVWLVHQLTTLRRPES